MLRMLLIFLWTAHVLVAVSTAQHPPTLIEDSVNVVTGTCSIFTQDMEVRGAEPIYINRLYNNGTQHKKNGGWIFIPHMRLTVEKHDSTYRRVIFNEPQGNEVYFTFPKKWDTGLIDLEIDLEKSFQKLGNSERGTISGTNNLKNIKVQITKSKTYIYVQSANGCKRRYKRREDFEMNAPKRKYLLEWEDLPSGNRIEYLYTPNNKLYSIQTINPRTGTVFAECIYDLHKSSLGCPDFDLKASDGQIINYTFEFNGHKNKKRKYRLATIALPEKPQEYFSYTSEREDQQGRINVRRFGKNKLIGFNYYWKGKNKTQSGIVEINNPEDFRLNRVKEIFSSAGTLYSFEYTDLKDGVGQTKVFDSSDNCTIYTYNKLYQITKIERFDKYNTPLNSHLYIWGKDENKGNLLASITFDEQGHPLIARTYSYDDWGNVTEETTWGEITGNSSAILTLNPNNFPINNGIDKVTKSYRYTQDGRNLLLYEKEENGLETFYTYLPNSSLPITKFIKANGIIRLRTFYEYNEDHFLVKETQDDGTSQDPNSLAGVTEQHIYRIRPHASAPFIGMPEWLEKSYLDLTTQKEISLAKTRLTYEPNRKVKRKDLYDSQDQLIYSITYKYDEHNNLIVESDPLGREATATYNDLFKKSTFTNFDRLVTHTFDYDNDGRLFKKEHIDPAGTKKVEQFDYNLKGHCIKKIDHYGNTTIFTYNADDNCIETTLPNGTILKKSYNSLSHLTSQTDGEGYTTHIRPNIDNKPLEIHHPDGTKQIFRYNPDGTLAEEIAPSGTITRYTYDLFKRLTTTSIYTNTGTLLTEETNHYNTFHLKKKIDPKGNAIIYHYDGAGRKIQETDGISTTHFAYDTLGRLTSTQTGSCTKQTTFNLINQVIKETIQDSQGTLVSEVSYEYDPLGNKTVTKRSIDGKPSTERIEYDSLSRPIRLTDPMGNIQTTSYDDKHLNSQGQFVLCKTHTAPNGNITTEIFDILGRLISQETQAFGVFLSRTTYLYDKNNQCIEQIDTIPQSVLITKRTYNPTGKISSLTEAADTEDQKVTTHEYDKAGRLDRIINPNGTVIEYTYDPHNRIHTLLTTGVCYRYHYDLLGRVIEVEDLIHRTSNKRAYDDQSNLIEEQLANGLTLTNKYDDQGRRKRMILPDLSSIEYTYDDYHLRTINRKDPQNNTTYTHQFLAYDLSSNLLQETNTTHHYNLNGAQDAIHAPHFSQTVEERDPLGNIQTQKTNQALEHFSYSALSQLTSEPTHIYTYDALHNRLSKDNELYDLNKANQLRSTPHTQYRNDPSGYPYLKETPTQTIRYTYDGLGRLTEAESHNNWRLIFIYDSFHRRLSRNLYHWTPNGWAQTKHQNFLYDDTCEIGSTDASHTIQELRILKDTAQAEIGAAIALELNNQIYIPIHDLQGNIRALLLNNQLVDSTTYTAYGETTHTICPWGFRSKRIDPELGLIFFGRRYYDPNTGRFFTPDPKGFIDGPNLYAYCHNNPLNKIDLYGLNIRIEANIELSTALKGLALLGSVVGTAIYHAVPFAPVREGGAIMSRLCSGKQGPYTSEPSSYNIVPGQKSSKTIIYSINGVLNDLPEARSLADHISRSARSSEVGYFHSATRGFISDILAAFWGQLGFQTADSIQIAMHLRTHLQFAQSANTKLYAFAHSRGGIYLCNALKLLSPEEKKMIHVYTYGSASLFQDSSLGSIKHNVSSGDLVPMLDPINYLKARFFPSSSSSVQFLSGKGGFLDRHFAMGQTYFEAREKDISGIIENSVDPK